MITVMTAMSELEEINYCMNRLWNMLKPYLKHDRIEEILQYVTSNSLEIWCAVDDMDLSDLGDDHFVMCKKYRKEGIKQLSIKEKTIKRLKNDK